MMWSHYDSFSWWWFVIMPLGMLGFWALVAWVVVTIVRGDRGDEPAASSAESILADRFAHGDIDAEEYHRRLDDLQTSSRARGSGS